MTNNFFWVVFEKVTITLLNLATLIIMGHLLMPEDYGVYGTMIIFISITETLIDAGFGGALIQKKTLHATDVNTLFFFNLFMSLLAYAILFFAASPIEDFYDIPNLSLYFRVIGITLIFYAFSLIQVTLLNRNLEFKKSALINITAYILSAGIAIFEACLGFGIWALISQIVLNALFLSILYWFVNRIKITFECSKESFVYMFKFGINTVGANIMQTIVNNITTSIIPKIGSANQAGLYFQANRINNVPNSILTQSIDKGIFPILSKEESDIAIIEKARLMNRYFLSIITPLFPIISIFSYLVIKILLGDQWLQASEYLAIIAYSGIAFCIQSVYRNVIKSTGKTKFILFAETIKSIMTLIVLFSSMMYGVKFLVYAFTISSYIGAAVWGIVLHVKFQYSLISQITDLVKPIIASMIMLAIITLININFDNYISVLIAPLAYALYWLISTLLLRNKELIDLTNKLSYRLLQKGK